MLGLCRRGDREGGWASRALDSQHWALQLPTVLGQAESGRKSVWRGRADTWPMMAKKRQNKASPSPNTTPCSVVLKDVGKQVTEPNNVAQGPVVPPPHLAAGSPQKTSLTSGMCAWLQNYIPQQSLQVRLSAAFTLQQWCGCIVCHSRQRLGVSLPHCADMVVIAGMTSPPMTSR